MKPSLTIQCLVGLALGVLLGMALPPLFPDAGGSALGVADGMTRLWTNALKLIVTPLIVAHLFLAISESELGKRNAARLGWIVPAVFVGLLVCIAVITALTTLGLLASPLIRNLGLADLMPPVSAADVAAAATPSGASWLDDLVPPNLIAAAARPQAILGVMLATVTFALAARRLAPDLTRPLRTLLEGVREALFVLIGWLLRIAPLVLLALGFRFALNSGLGVGKFLLVHLGVEVAIVLICLAALYPIAVLGGRLSPALFARAAFPAQAAAAASRSSASTIPILLRDARTGLGVPEAVSALVIPLAGAVLKLSPVVNYFVKFLFLAVVLGIPLSLEKLIVFEATVILLSPATQGIPSVIPAIRALPAYVAAGIPAEYVILLGSTRAFVDIFLSVLNSTGYLTVTVLVSRFAGSSARVSPASSAASEPLVSRPGVP